MPTIRDVAKEAGLSPACVSRILNNDSSLQVTPDTRRRVIETAKKMGYVRKPKSVSKAAFKLGILQWFSAKDELEDDYYLKIRRGIEDFCIKNSIEVVRAYRTDGGYKTTLGECDGIVCVGKFSKKDADRLIKFKSNIVFVDMKVKHPGVTTVNIDLKSASEDILGYLKKLGHERIAFLGGIEYASGSEVMEDTRHKTYVRFMKKNKLPYAQYKREGQFNIKSGYEMMKDILENAAPLPTAVFAASDAIAIGAMRAIKEKGLKIPDDISVAGINDDDMSSYTQPALTTMHAPSYDMGQHAANLVYVAGNLDIKTPLKVNIPCTMIVRESCATCTKTGN